MHNVKQLNVLTLGDEKRKELLLFDSVNFYERKVSYEVC